MRKNPAKKYHSKSTHSNYGIYNWFRSKGVTDFDVIKETIHNFCIEYGFDTKNIKFTDGSPVYNWVSNKFGKFSNYAINFLRENNYINK